MNIFVINILVEKLFCQSTIEINFVNALLHYTSQVCNQLVVEYLIKCVADVNAFDRACN